MAQYEAENFSVSGPSDSYVRRTGNDPDFTSGGSLLWLSGTGDTPQTASFSAVTPAADKIIVPVRGQECFDPSNPADRPWPHFTVKIDGTQVMSAYADSHVWLRTGALQLLPAGSHTFTITFDNEYSRPACDRSLLIDFVALYDDPDAPPLGTPFPQRTWAPVGALPLPDDVAASLITHQPESRPENAGANDYVPSDDELDAFHSAPGQGNYLAQYVTGRPGLSNPSTDDLIQWAAHKWGIPEDAIRAQMVVESGWDQSHLGDRRTVSSDWYTLYPPQAQISGTSDVYQSMGISQVKWRPDGSVGAGSEPLRWESTAFNLDYYAATIRYYYNGRCVWCTDGYEGGRAWKSIGAWFQPTPWLNAGQLNYIGKVSAALANRTWESY